MDCLCESGEILDNAEAVYSRYNDTCHISCGKFSLEGLQ